MKIRKTPDHCFDNLPDYDFAPNFVTLDDQEVLLSYGETIALVPGDYQLRVKGYTDHSFYIEPIALQLFANSEYAATLKELN